MKEIEKQIVELLKKLLDDSSVNVDSCMDNTEDWDSLFQIVLMSEIEENFDVKIDSSEYMKMNSVKAISEYISLYRGK